MIRFITLRRYHLIKKPHEIDTVFTLYYCIVNKNRNRLLLILLSKTTG